jgi:purine-binding chemotaxis protein CheW
MAMADTVREVRLIAFRVAGESFVLDIMAIRQIIPYGGSTPVPKAPHFIEGIIVLRNEVIPIIDLRLRLFPQLALEAGAPLVLVTRTSYGTIGLKVEEVRRILTVDTEAILTPPPLVRGLEGDFFIGVIEQKDDLLLLLDLETLLSSDEKRELTEADLAYRSEGDEKRIQNSELRIQDSE